MNPLRLLIRRFDSWLSRRHAIWAFTDDPQCILRIQVRFSTHLLELPDGVIKSGARVLMVHMWNERAPLIPREGPGLAWALDMRRKMTHSLEVVACQLKSDLSLQDVRAVGGITAHVLLAGGGGKSMLEHLGFSVMPYERPLGAFGEFWENFYTWWVMWTFNPISTRRRSMFKLQRVEFWMSTPAFLEKYASKSSQDNH